MKPVLDPFAPFRALTRARVGLGRAGDALPTGALLDFQEAQARARDAVHGVVDFTELSSQLSPLPILHVHSCAADRIEYLRRPDRGRRLRESDRERVAAARGSYDLSVVVVDGLSASAVNRRAAPLVSALCERLGDLSWAPLVLAEQGRVALGDEVGELLGARFVAVLIGERPGLSVSDSLGIYLTWQPRVGRTDAERNCISNIHADGLSPEAAAEVLDRLVRLAGHHQLTGVDLKLDALDEVLGQ